MSVGNVTQAVRFTDNGLTLVLGNNVDLGGDGSPMVQVKLLLSMHSAMLSMAMH